MLLVFESSFRGRCMLVLLRPATPRAGAPILSTSPRRLPGGPLSPTPCRFSEPPFVALEINGFGPVLVKCAANPAVAARPGPFRAPAGRRCSLGFRSPPGWCRSRSWMTRSPPTSTVVTTRMQSTCPPGWKARTSPLSRPVNGRRSSTSRARARSTSTTTCSCLSGRRTRLRSHRAPPTWRATCSSSSRPPGLAKTSCGSTRCLTRKPAR